MIYLPIYRLRAWARPQSPAEWARIEQAYYEDNAGAEWRMPSPARRVLAGLLPAVGSALRQVVTSLASVGRQTTSP
jgi:hypothetical protein